MAEAGLLVSWRSRTGSRHPNSNRTESWEKRTAAILAGSSLDHLLVCQVFNTAMTVARRQIVGIIW